MPAHPNRYVVIVTRRSPAEPTIHAVGDPTQLVLVCDQLIQDGDVTRLDFASVASGQFIRMGRSVQRGPSGVWEAVD